MIRKTAFILVSCLISALAYAQSLDTAKLNTYFSTLEQHNKFMGSVAVSQNGQLIYTRSAGFSEVETGQHATGNSKYRIGSISKTFTAVMVLKAVENKKLDLNQSIKSFFPAIQNADQITIRQLLSHRSGIHNFTDDADYLTWNTQAKTEKELLAIIAKGGSDFKPDSTADYSNSNYILLTFILEKALKAPYAELLEKYIAKPLGLKNTYLCGKIDPLANECRSYSYEDGWKVSTETDCSIPLGAGGIISTAGDLAKFSDALFHGKLLRKESLELMKTMREDFGLGLFELPFYDKSGFGHRGGIDEFTSAFTYFADGDVSFVILSNGMNYNGNEIPLAVLSAVYQKPFDIPDFSVYEIKEEDLERYVGVYASEQIPITLTITKEGKTLIAQATGQSANPLQASGKDTFRIEDTSIVLEFNPEAKTMLLKQGGAEFTFTKE